MGWSVVPKERRFFALFARLSAKVVEGAHLLQDLMTDYTRIEAKILLIRAVEHEADIITHEVLDALNKSFITPIEREDIRALAQYLDTVLDDIEGTANRFTLYHVKKPTPQAIEMSRLICQATEQIHQAVQSLENLKQIHIFVVEINRLENMADNISRAMIGKLFEEEQDVRELIRWKDIYEKLERCADRCEDVANIIEDIVVKNT
jgi:predicted phosphate transport protein (TIGR00153 family)